ncbi:hypothetical protein RND81_02G206400 [Saponaria officinalis]|uniref:Uncharacterized protein n=1 Tax=Saponaria officinalis TaxID=3572 RepID=A0AAW1MNF1_SAPOF
MSASVVTKNFTLKSVAFFILIILLILVSCQANLFMLDYDTIIIKQDTTNKKVFPTRKMGTTSSSLECKGDVLVCQEHCQFLGCFFTCIDDVGFSCLCHCDR